MLDLNALRDTLRRFAAARDRQPLHTPKNLAMALTVEAAGLAAVFQWMTPEQSRAARGDAQLQQQVAGGVADVLLTLVQLADHMGVELEHTVGRRLAEHANKHPPLRPQAPNLRVDEAVGKASARAADRSAAADIDTHVLVDWENVQPEADDIRALVPDATDIWLFHGPSQKGVAAKHASFGDKATLVKIARAGKNALDFHLSFYMGYIAARHPDARFVVISNDKGYAPMLEHAAELGFSARQLGFVKPAAAGAGPARRATRRKAPAGPVAAKKAPATSKAPATPAKKAAATPAKKAPRTPATPAAKKVAAKKTPAPAAKAVAGKLPAAKKVAAPARSAGAAKAADAKAPSAFDLRKAVRHVVAGLGSSSRPTRQTKLLAVIRSLLGPSADEQAVQAVLAQLVASGQVAIDGRGQVRYALQPA